jgi:hypothetical protein
VENVIASLHAQEVPARAQLATDHTVRQVDEESLVSNGHDDTRLNDVDHDCAPRADIVRHPGKRGPCEDQGAEGLHQPTRQPRLEECPERTQKRHG